jgi:hypothetical protein
MPVRSRALKRAYMQYHQYLAVWLCSVLEEIHIMKKKNVLLYYIFINYLCV